MTKRPYDDLPPATRRRLLLRTVLRPILTTTSLLILYYVLPLGDRDVSPTAVTFAIELVLVGVLLSLQVRQISIAEHPRLRAIEALSFSLPLFILMFAAVYYEIARGSPGSFTQDLTRTDSLYFTVTTFASVGFGDITPVSQTTRVLVMIQMVVDLILVGIIAHAIVGAVKTGLRRKQPDVGPGSP
jgi:voltage-gated potassium channel